MGWITDLLKDIPLSAVLREKLADLEAQHARVTKENKVLKSENRDLRKQLEAAHREIATFKERDEKELWHGSNRSALETQILMLLAQNASMETEQIRVATEQGVEANIYHLETLARARLIKSSPGRDLETYWQLTHNGRGYLVQRGLIR